MSTAGRNLHDRALRLAASLLDFGLAQGEIEELETHLDGCPACRRDAVALRADAAILNFAVVPTLPSRRVDDAVYAAIAGRRRPFQGTFVLVAASLLLVALMGVATAGAVLLGIWPPQAPDSTPPAPPPSTNVDPTPVPSIDVATPRPDAGWTAVPGTLPAGNGRVQMAPGPYGGLYVVVNDAHGAVVALLDAAGDERPGWPTELPGWTCDAPGTSAEWAPGVAADGSLRLVCHDNGTDDGSATAFAFDAAGRPLVGWPVDLPGRSWFPPRVVDGTLVVASNEGGEPPVAGPDGQGDAGDPGAYRLVTVDADGTLRTGAPVAVAEAKRGLVSIGPDGTAYVVDGNVITAFDQGGARAGWPVRLEGILSALGFGPDGRVYLTTSPDGATSHLVAVDRDGRLVEVAREGLPIGGASAWSGTGPANRPLAPLVAADGTAYVIGEADGETVVYGIDPSGARMNGWPYRAATAVPWQGTCADESTACGVWRALPAVGPGGVLYLPLAVEEGRPAGSLVAVGRDGQVVLGWPVRLKRTGAEFWSVVTATNETAYALAVEPERGRKTSATVIDAAPDSSVRFRTTVVMPGAD